MRQCQEQTVLLPAGHRMITATEFALFRALILREAGIQLSPNKREMLMGRLNRRLRALGLTSYGAYYTYVTEAGDGELGRMLDAISTNQTSFFREPRQWEFLAQRVFPEWRASHAGPRRIRAWSAACATGEETYSLAMMLVDFFPPAAGWGIEIRGTDLSTRVLERARTGVWPLEEAAEIPDKYLRAYMLRGTGPHGGTMKAGPQIRSVLQFDRLNLHDAIYPALGSFDLIFCRNVLMYFSAEAKRQVVARLLKHLLPTAYLFVGHAETLNGVSRGVRTIIPTVYAPVAA